MGEEQLQQPRPPQPREARTGVQVEYGWSTSEREVLRALWSSSGQHLVRSEIHRRMPRACRPTLGRIGQILAALCKDGVLNREYRRSQGSREAGFYTLSERGRELCQELGFEREERLLFQVTDDVLRTCLTRERLARCLEAPGRIVAVYGYRRGLGRTTLAAHLARGLAERLGDHEQLLVVDLDLGASGLDAFFPLKKPGCRGLGGLIVDYRRQAPQKRALWLFGALSAPEYVVRPLKGVPDLVYLPSGLSPGQCLVSSADRAEALAVLHAEAGLATSARSGDPDLKALGFMVELRATLLAKFSKTVADPEPGHSLGAWIATQALADHLIVCAQTGDDSPVTLRGLRTVLASFLLKFAGIDSGAVQFIFRLTELGPGEDLNRWIDVHLAMATAATQEVTYWTERLPYEARFAKQGVSWIPALYTHLVDRLKSSTSPSRPMISANLTLQLLMDVLDPHKDRNDRFIAAGALKACPLQELAQWVDWYVREKSFHTATDAQGKNLIKDIVQVQSERLLSKILEAQMHVGRNHNQAR